MTQEAPAESGRWDGWLSPRQWIPVVGLLAGGLLILGALLAMRWDDDAAGADGSGVLRQDVHQHADFALVIRGERFDFGKPEFIWAEDNGISDNAHIHDPRHTVAHIHKEQTTWDEFLGSMGFKLTDPSYQGVDQARTCMELPGGEKLCSAGADSWKFVVNGVQVDGVANTIMSDTGRVLISYGAESDVQLLAQYEAQVTDQACIPSELCQKRLPPEGEPPEPCSKSGTSCVGRG